MKNLKIIRVVILLCITIPFTTSVFAQHNHSSHAGSYAMGEEQPPNGGVIKDAGKYKIEMVADLFLKRDQLRFYLFKKNLKPILNKDITGTITIKSHDGKTSTQSLQAKGDDFFIAQLENSDPFQASIKFIVKGKTISTVFVHKGIGNHHTSIYSCSMHPEIESDSAGKCPKCGMNLILK